jgi:hypothetical protein
MMNRRDFVTFAALLPLVSGGIGIAKAECVNDSDNVQAMLDYVIEKMNTSMGSHPLPKVKMAEEAPDQVYLDIWGFLPATRTRVYHWPSNTIYLTQGDTNRHLVHELVHFVQVKYQRANLKADSTGAYEMQAKMIEMDYAKMVGDETPATNCHNCCR